MIFPAAPAAGPHKHKVKTTITRNNTNKPNKMNKLRTLCTVVLSAGMAMMAYAGSKTEPVDYVSTLVGTASSYEISTGNTYPAIAMPWGMNFWVPQTGKNGDGWFRLTAFNTLENTKEAMERFKKLFD